MLQEKVASHGLDTHHFVKRSPWHKYPDAAIAEAATASSSLREVALNRRAASRLGLDTSHFKRRAWGRAERPVPSTVHGDWLDNRVENLRYLCPNCHALTSTWCRRKAGRPSEGTESPVH
ncbi:hypothetical protein [Streptomyces sp. NPDC002516]